MLLKRRNYNTNSNPNRNRNLSPNPNPNPLHYSGCRNSGCRNSVRLQDVARGRRLSVAIATFFSYFTARHCEADWIRRYFFKFTVIVVVFGLKKSRNANNGANRKSMEELPPWQTLQCTSCLKVFSRLFGNVLLIMPRP